MIDVYPGDVIQFTKAYHDGMRLILPQTTVALVVAVFADATPVTRGSISRAMDRIWLMPAGELRYYDLQQHWVRSNCKRLTAWTTKV